MDEKETGVYTVIMISSMVIGLILVYFFYSVLRQHRKNMELQRQLVLAEITALEKDRARIASDLHDEFSPVLAAIKIKINNFDLPSIEDNRELQRINSHIDNVFSRMREISFDLVPTVLFQEGLVAAFKEFSEFINNKKGLQINVQTVSELNLSEQKAINIYRIIQEIVHNTIKHANACNLTINLTKEKNCIILNSKDDGMGFDHSTTLLTSKGIGLRSLFNRTRLLNGEMFVDSKKGAGTEYIFTFPYYK